MSRPPSSMKSHRYTEALTALGVLFVLALLIVPLPGFMVDLFIAASLGSAVIVLLVSAGSLRDGQPAG